MIPLVTIDGPSGVGKSTLVCRLAKKLGWHFLNSGSLYRLLAYEALNKQVDLHDETQLVALLPDLAIRFELADADSTTSPIRFFLNNIDVTREIAMEACTMASSKIATLPKVRTALLGKQRDFWRAPGLIAEGRDMGTVVFPTAPLKIFLQASPEARAKRRANQLKQMAIDVSIDTLSRDIAERDARDKARKTAPLKPAADAEVIDTTVLNPDEVLDYVLNKVSSMRWGSTCIE